MESLTPLSPIDSTRKLPTIRRTVRLSYYQIFIAIVGCAVISFRAGLVISTHHRNKAVQPLDQCTNSNIATPNAAITSRASEHKLQLETGCSTSKNTTYLKIFPHCIDNDTCSTTNGISVETLHEIRHHHHQRRSITPWPGNDSVLHRDKSYNGTVAFFEALVHPALLIHPEPNRVVIINDIGGQVLQHVLKHKNVPEVIYILPESFKNMLLSPNLSDSRVVVVYRNDLVPYFHHSVPIDILFVDAVTYPNVTDPSFVNAINSALGECGILVCHTGPAESMRNLPVSFLNSINNVSSSNRWVAFIDAMHRSNGFQNIVDYSENNEKIVLGMKCQQCRANWIWNAAVIQVQISKRIMYHGPDDSTVDLFFDGPTMVNYQFPSRIVEEVWCRTQRDIGIGMHDDNVYAHTDASSCTGHGFDPDVINVPVSALVVNTSLVANGGRGVFTTQPIVKGSTIILDDCVQGMIIPITTLNLLEAATRTMENVSEFWDVVSVGFAHGYGWSESFLGGPEELGGVDTSISTFANHGCRGSYNVGIKYDFHEMNVMDCGPEKPCITCDDQEFKIYDPYQERQYPMWGCPQVVANRDIELGEEILYDYMCMSGTDNMLEQIDDLQYLCSGGIGFVSQYEREALVAATD